MRSWLLIGLNTHWDLQGRLEAAAAAVAEGQGHLMMSDDFFSL